MLLHYHNNNDLCKARGINCDFDWLIIDHFCEPVDDDKDWVIAISLPICQNWYIGKFYVGPIQKADLRSRWSTGIHLWVLLIHLQALFLASVRLWSYLEPDCGSMSTLDLIWSLIERSIRFQVIQVLLFCYLDLLLSLLTDPQLHWLDKCYSCIIPISRWVCLQILKYTSWNRSLLWHLAKSGVTLSYFDIFYLKN